MARVLDRNGVLLTRGQRVELTGRTGTVVGTLGRADAFIKFDDALDDTLVAADKLITIDAVHETRRRGA